MTSAGASSGWVTSTFSISDMVEWIGYRKSIIDKNGQQLII